MSQVSPDKPHSFALQKKMSDPSRQPLEVYHLSHDLRGPLNSILGFTELLLEEIEGPLNEMQHTDLAAIYQSAQNLLQLVNTVVDLSKLEANRLVFDFGTVDLPDVIQDVITSDFGTIRPEQVELVANLPPTVPAVRGDRDRIEQLLKSLLRFAFRVKKKGAITLAAHSDDQDVTIEMQLGEIRLPHAELEELFELMVIVDASGRSELGPGGLDLPLAHFLAEKQQGRLWVELQNDTQCTFYVSLPLQQKD